MVAKPLMLYSLSSSFQWTWHQICLNFTKQPTGPRKFFGEGELRIRMSSCEKKEKTTAGKTGWYRHLSLQTRGKSEGDLGENGAKGKQCWTRKWVFPPWRVGSSPLAFQSCGKIPEKNSWGDEMANLAPDFQGFGLFGCLSGLWGGQKFESWMLLQGRKAAPSFIASKPGVGVGWGRGEGRGRDDLDLLMQALQWPSCKQIPELAIQYELINEVGSLNIQFSQQHHCSGTKPSTHRPLGNAS